MFLMDFFSKGFGGPAVGEDPRESFVEVSAAGLAQILVSPQIQVDLSLTEAFMTDTQVESVFDSKIGILAIEASWDNLITDF